MFTPELFRFLQDLAANNDRTWFGVNRTRYEQTVREPAMAFIERLDPALRKRVSPYLQATRSSLFRIHRDTRFSRDKRPYKTHAGMHFPLGAETSGAGLEDVHRPGYYLHLEPGHCFIGCGLWHPSTDVLHKVREAIVAREAEWGALGLPLEGESLKRPPAGFSKTHPFVKDLMRKDFVTSKTFTEEEICKNDFLERYVDECVRMAPLMQFICRALNLPWK